MIRFLPRVRVALFFQFSWMPISNGCDTCHVEESGRWNRHFFLLYVGSTLCGLGGPKCCKLNCCTPTLLDVIGDGTDNHLSCFCGSSEIPEYWVLTGAKWLIGEIQLRFKEGNDQARRHKLGGRGLLAKDFLNTLCSFIAASLTTAQNLISGWLNPTESEFWKRKTTRSH